MISAHLRNLHDSGFDIAVGQDVTAGAVIGKIGWDDTPGNPGLVLTILEEPGRLGTGDEVLLPDGANDAFAMLIRRGYALDESSKDDVKSLSIEAT